MTKFTIKINNPSHHFSNPLLKLDGREFDSRDEACEAIYAALEGVICGDGCEMVLQSEFAADENDECWMDRYCSACHEYIMREGYASEDGVSADVVETTTIIDELHRGVWPVNACLRWNTREDVCIESGLIPNEYAHEITDIKADGVFGYSFDEQMTPEAVEAALDFIVENSND